MSATWTMTAWTLLVAVGVVACSTAQGTEDSEGLKDVFYAEIRQLLHRHSEDALQTQETAAPAAPLRPPRPREVPEWGVGLAHLGQVSGVAVNPQGQPVIFHRGSRVWDQTSFNDTNVFQHIADGPIAEDTVLTLDPKTGAIVDGSWGKDLFYLPHGLSIDHENNAWLTDVALHQVFKFVPGSASPALVFGVRFRPGSRRGHLCKPTSVAVATSGEIFIADGYCNSRVLKFDASGELLRVLPQPPEFLSLQIPHSLALVESLDLLCIADRENMRVTCPKAGLGQDEHYRRRPSPAITIQEPDLGRVFAVAALGDMVYAVNGATSRMIPVRGFTIDPQAETIVDHWSPDKGFRNPHDIAISPDGSTLYVVELGPNKVWKFELKRVEK